MRCATSVGVGCGVAVFVAFFGLPFFGGAVVGKSDVAIDGGCFSKVVSKLKFVAICGIKINGIVGMQVRFKTEIAAAVSHHLDQLLQIVVVSGGGWQCAHFNGITCGGVVVRSHLQVVGVGALCCSI